MESNREAETIANTVGKCPVCEGTLMMRRGKFGKFIACDKYPDCKTTFKLPQYGTIKPIEKVCEVCGYPMVKIIKKRGAQEICINQDCKSKKLPNKLEKELKKIEDGKVEKICPKCGKPLVVRRSVYGSFFGCSGFPKCRHIEKVQDEEKAKKLKEKVLKEKKK